MLSVMEYDPSFVLEGEVVVDGDADSVMDVAGDTDTVGMVDVDRV